MKSVKLLTRYCAAAGFLLAALISCPAPADADEGWTPPATISGLMLVGSYGWIQLDGWSGAYNFGSAGCTDIYGFIVDNDDGSFDQQYRTLLAAFLAGRQVSLRVENDPGNGACRVTRILMN